MSHVRKRERVSQDGRKTVAYLACYQSPEGDDVSKTFKLKRDAEAYLHTVEVAILQGSYVDPKAGKIPLADYLNGWLDIQVWKESTDQQVRCHMRNHVLPELGPLALRSLSRRRVQQWIADRSEHLAPSTLKVVHGYLSSVLKSAVQERLIVSNPCDGTKLPKQPKSLVTPPTTDEVWAIINALPDRFRAFGVLLAGTGLRQSEARGLTVDRVHFRDGQHIRVDRQLVHPVGGGVVLGPPKTDASIRRVPAAELVLAELARHLQTYPTSHDLGLVFSDEKGQPLRRSRVGAIWNRARDSVGVRSDITPHDFRHYYASLLIHSGLSVKAVQQALGHASARETLDIYAHLWPDDEGRLRDAVQEILGDVTVYRQASHGPMEEAEGVARVVAHSLGDDWLSVVFGE